MKPNAKSNMKLIVVRYLNTYASLIVMHLFCHASALRLVMVLRLLASLGYSVPDASRASSSLSSTRMAHCTKSNPIMRPGLLLTSDLLLLRRLRSTLTLAEKVLDY